MCRARLRGILNSSLFVFWRPWSSFPLLPALWIDLGHVCRRRDDAPGEIAALTKAVQLNPSWSAALRELPDAYERGGQLDHAQEVLERAIKRAPVVAGNHAELAELLWRKGEREHAFERIRHAFALEPGKYSCARAARPGRGAGGARAAVSQP